MAKRGQIAIFLIVGIVIFLAVSAFIWYRYSFAKETGAEAIEKTRQEGAIINSFVESCLARTANEAVLDNGYNGGYFTLPEESTTELSADVPYYFKQGEDLSPADEVLAQEIGKYIDAMLILCLEDFQALKKQGYGVEFEEPVSKVTLTAMKITVQMHMPITLTIGSSKKTASEFTAEIPADNFYQDLAAAREIVNTQNGEEICLSCVSSIAAQNNLVITVNPTYDKTYVYVIEDNNYFISEEKFKLRFAIKYG